MLYNITTALLIQATSSLLNLSGSIYGSGLLKYKDGSVQVSWHSDVLKTSNLYSICNNLHFSSYPLFKLLYSNISSQDIYRVDGCVTCYDLYLECHAFPFKLDDGGDLRMFFDSKWLPVCFKKTLTFSEAKTICQVLKLPSNTTEIQTGKFGSGSNSWKIVDSCSERTSTNCRTIRRLVANGCQGSDLLTIRCKGEGPAYRLMSWGKEGHRGTIEVKVGEYWFPICANDFTLNDAKVACRSLQYHSTDSNYNMKRVGTSDYPRNPGSFYCSGREAALKHCPGAIPEYSYCSSNYVIEISCDNAQEGKLRLAGGYDGVSGRLEIYHSNVWGTVCANTFGELEINVACIEITSDSARRGKKINSMGVLPATTVDDIALERVYCGSQNIRLGDCYHETPLGEHNCSNNNIVYMSCSEEPRFQIVGGSGRSGRLEVYHDSQWGVICGMGLGQEEAKTACETLQLPSIFAAVYTQPSPLNRTDRIWLDTLRCGRSAKSLKDCVTGRWGQIDPTCSRHLDAFISCPRPERSNVQFSLSGPEAGIVRAYHPSDYERSGFCINNPSLNIAIVACRSLGLPTQRATLLPENAVPGLANTTTLLKILECTGTELNLLGCQHSPIGAQGSCSRKLAVACGKSMLPDYTLRLLSRYNRTHSGRLQVLMYGVWGSVCNTSFTDKSAEVACRKLGLPTSWPVALYTTPDGKSEHSWLTNVACTGWETDLKQCSNKIRLGTHWPGTRDFVCEQSIQCKTYRFPDKAIMGIVVGSLLVIGLFIGAVCCCKKKCRKCCRSAPSAPPPVYVITSEETEEVSLSPTPSAPFLYQNNISTISNSQNPEPEPLSADEMKPPPSYNELFPERVFRHSVQESFI